MVVRSALSKARYVHLATHGFFADPKYSSPLTAAAPKASAVLMGSRFTAAPEIGGAPSRRKPTMKGLIMKMLLNALVIGLVGGFSLGAFRASADLEVSAAVQIHANADFDAPRRKTRPGSNCPPVQ